MKGYVIPETKICVDYWDDEDKDYFRFLTHAHQNRLDGIDKVNNITIYASEFTAWYLKNILLINNNSYEHLLIGKTYHLSSGGKDNEFSFVVTLIDANHCPGSVMYLFQGSFGNVLCTGDFRYTPAMTQNPFLKEVSEKKSLDILHFDNKFVGEHCDIPALEVARAEVIDVIRSFPDHRIEICVGVFGKIYLLKYIAEELRVPICVSDSCMAVVQELGWSELFTTDKDTTTTRIFAQEIDIVDIKSVRLQKKKYGPVKFILLTPIYLTSSNFGLKHYRCYKTHGIHIIPYSDHSCHKELVEFISFLMPSTIIPIFEPLPNGSYEGDFDGINKNVIIPEKILKIISGKKFQLNLFNLLSSGSSDLFLSCEEAINVSKNIEVPSSRSTQLNENCPPLKSINNDRTCDSLSSSSLESTDLSKQVEGMQNNQSTTKLKRKLGVNAIEMESGRDSMDFETSSSDDKSQCKKKQISTRKRRGSIKKTTIMSDDSSDDLSDFKTCEKQNLSIHSKIEQKKRCVRNSNEPVVSLASDSHLLASSKNLTGFKEHILPVRKHRKRSECGSRILTTLHNSKNDNSLEEIPSVSRIEENQLHSSSESISVLQIGASDIPNINMNLVSDEREILKLNYTTSIFESKQTISEDKINFWISRGYNYSVFKRNPFLNIV